MRPARNAGRGGFVGVYKPHEQPFGRLIKRHLTAFKRKRARILNNVIPVKTGTADPFSLMGLQEQVSVFAVPLDAGTYGTRRAFAREIYATLWTNPP